MKLGSLGAANKSPQILLVTHNHFQHYLKLRGCHVRLIIPLSSFTKFAFLSFFFFVVIKSLNYCHFLSRWLLTIKFYFYFLCFLNIGPSLLMPNVWTGEITAKAILLIDYSRILFIFPSIYPIKLEAHSDAEFSLIAVAMLATKPHRLSSPGLTT